MLKVEIKFRTSKNVISSYNHAPTRPTETVRNILHSHGNSQKIHCHSSLAKIYLGPQIAISVTSTSIHNDLLYSTASVFFHPRSS